MMTSTQLLGQLVAGYPGYMPPPSGMEGRLSDQELWSWVDRDAPELGAYLDVHPDDESRVAEIRGALDQLAQSACEEMPTRIGPFRILGLLGRGGMGLVYDAEQDSPRRAVALKVLPREVAGDRRRLQLFRREADALARLSHPGIATVFEVGDVDAPYIAMKRVSGVPLDRYLDEHEISQRQRLQLFASICEAVGHAHEHGIVHRDLKPANILVEEDGQPVVVDFGLALVADEATRMATRTGTVLGTIPYMSPEQIRGSRENLGPASDVFSLGTLLVELITGQLPHDSRECSLPEAARRVCEEPPRLGGRLRGAIRTVAIHTLEKDPGRRYRTAGDLAADVRRVLDGAPTLASRPTWVRRGAHALRRHWMGTVLATATVAFVVALALPPQIRVDMVGRYWWREGSPFEALRWSRNAPEVRFHGRWYELAAIDGVPALLLVGQAQNVAPRRWRKRFSEDLVQLLHRSGSWSFFTVDLSLRDLETGQIVQHEDVPLDKDRRTSILSLRSAFPWRWLDVDGELPIVELAGRPWLLTEFDGVDFGEVWERVSRRRTYVATSETRDGITFTTAGSHLFDALCDRLGYSPGVRTELGLVDVETDLFETRVVTWPGTGPAMP